MRTRRGMPFASMSHFARPFPLKNELLPRTDCGSSSPGRDAPYPVKSKRRPGIQ